MSEVDVFDALKYHIEVDRYGTRRYYNAAGQLHRLDGPAVIYQYGLMFWYQNGQRHRTDGPAVVYTNNELQWWFINGVQLTEAEFNQAIKSL